MASGAGSGGARKTRAWIMNVIWMKSEEKRLRAMYSALKQPVEYSGTPYNQRMTQLRRQIFSEVTRPTDADSSHVVRLFSTQPLDQNRRLTRHHTFAHPQMWWLVKCLRLHGLYVDEHLDYHDFIRLERAKKGKVPPAPGQGKRAALKNKKK